MLVFECENLVLGWNVRERRKGAAQGPAASAGSNQAQYFVFQSFPMVDFAAFEGCLPIVGRTGVGKSTLLYAMSGLALPVGGRIGWSLPAAEAPIIWDANGPKPEEDPRPLQFGFLLQDAEMVPCFTVRENLDHALALRGKRENAKDRTERIRRTVDLMKAKGEKLDELLDKYPSQLSGGMRKRMALAVAIAHDPVVLFADEPTGSLDKETSITILQRIHGWLDADGAKGRRAFVCVTHNEDWLKEGLAAGAAFRVSAAETAGMGANTSRCTVTRIDL
ncbi:MAG: ATP-binding cassette domain-containing protein [Hyphomicrobiaceae bacterium]